MKIKHSTKWAVVGVLVVFAIWVLSTLSISVSRGQEFWFGWTVGTRIALILFTASTCAAMGLSVKLLMRPKAPPNGVV